jgi:hypothetical protein
MPTPVVEPVRAPELGQAAAPPREVSAEIPPVKTD